MSGITPCTASCSGRSVRVNICSSGMSAICSGTICSAKISTNRKFEPLNLIHANAYAAMDAMTSGNSVAGIAMASEFTKYEPSCGDDCEVESSTSW